MCAKTIHDDVDLARADGRPSPSRGRRRARSPGRARCRSGSRPSTSTGAVAATSSGRFASSQRSARSTSGERPRSGTANSYQARSQPRLRRSALSRAGRRRSRKPKVSAASGIACSLRQPSTVLSWRSRCSSGGASASQLSPKVYGMTSGGTTPSIRSIRKNGVPSTSPVGSSHRPSAPGRRSSRRPAGSRRTGGPAGRTGTPGRPRSEGATRATHFSSCCSTLGLPASGQDDGLRGHPVGVDAALHGDLRRGAAGHAPWTATATSRRAAC